MSNCNSIDDDKSNFPEGIDIQYSFITNKEIYTGALDHEKYLNINYISFSKRCDKDSFELKYENKDAILKTDFFIETFQKNQCEFNASIVDSTLYLKITFSKQDDETYKKVTDLCKVSLEIDLSKSVINKIIYVTTKTNCNEDN